MTAQLGFANLLTDAATANERRQMDRATSHLPGTMEEALPCYRRMIERHHAAMQTAAINEAMSIREEAHLLAAKLNGGTCGIIAGPDAPGCILERESAAPPDSAPLWGQAGEFVVTVGAMRVRIELHGMFGIGSTFCLFPGFYAHAVDRDRPFLSETGFRAFFGVSGQLIPGLTTADFVRETIAAHVRQELKGRLSSIKARQSA
ncbi:hypothetical protein [Methylocapsa aurea]|uniref:hypothetical protein n=1 Tax=Methylocapsa aurea TaxID=663610 RepID=UPI000689BB68|nr:hypothetical protein [Methylocapsa aurea]